MKVNIKYESRDLYGEEILDVIDFEISSGKGKQTLHFVDCSECPEDASFGRALSSVYSIKDALTLAYEAGKNGEAFELAEEDVKDE